MEQLRLERKHKAENSLKTLSMAIACLAAILFIISDYVANEMISQISYWSSIVIFFIAFIMSLAYTIKSFKTKNKYEFFNNVITIIVMLSLIFYFLVIK